jgi:2-(1,2-epoxy-1,2-dihydrophenyl)acetyl-CoA isomerase
VLDGVGVITLNRPDRRNALHQDMYAPMQQALADFAHADDVGCIVLTGAGTGFCAGGDVRDGRPRTDGAPPTLEEKAAGLLANAQVSRLLHESPKITIAAVNGAAVGAGLSLALACDLRIMARSASYTPGWGRLAFSGDFGGTWFLTRMLGPSKALEMLVLNQKLTADESLAAGLANRLVEDSDFAEAWRSWAALFAAGPRDAIALMKQNVRQALEEPLATALVSESERMVRSGLTQDHKEAVRAWLAKREPDFRRQT